MPYPNHRVLSLVTRTNPYSFAFCFKISLLIFPHFIENFKCMAKLKEFYSEQLATHRLDSTVAILPFFYLSIPLFFNLYYLLFHFIVNYSHFPLNTSVFWAGEKVCWVFHNILQKNLNILFGQPNIYHQLMINICIELPHPYLLRFI